NRPGQRRNRQRRCGTTDAPRAVKGEARSTQTGPLPLRLLVVSLPPANLGPDTRDDVALHQLARLVQVVVHDGPRGGADAVVDRRQQLARVDRVLQRRRRGLVRPAVDEAALDAGPGDAGGVAVRPVVAAVVLVLVARRAQAALRAAAELADRHHQRLV